MKLVKPAPVILLSARPGKAHNFGELSVTFGPYSGHTPRSAPGQVTHNARSMCAVANLRCAITGIAETGALALPTQSSRSGRLVGFAAKVATQGIRFAGFACMPLNGMHFLTCLNALP
jgi:hypothetical protein